MSGDVHQREGEEELKVKHDEADDDDEEECTIKPALFVTHCNYSLSVSVSVCLSVSLSLTLLKVIKSNAS